MSARKNSAAKPESPKRAKTTRKKATTAPTGVSAGQEKNPEQAYEDWVRCCDRRALPIIAEEQARNDWWERHLACQRTGPRREWPYCVLCEPEGELTPLLLVLNWPLPDEDEEALRQAQAKGYPFRFDSQDLADVRLAVRFVQRMAMNMVMGTRNDGRRLTRHEAATPEEDEEVRALKRLAEEHREKLGQHFEFHLTEDERWSVSLTSCCTWNPSDPMTVLPPKALELLLTLRWEPMRLVQCTAPLPEDKRQCGRWFVHRRGRGRPRAFCSGTCRRRNAET